MAVTALVDLVADVLPHLNMVVTEPSAVLDEIQGFIDDCTPIIEDMVGHVVPAVFDEFYDGGDTAIYLRELPVLEVTSVREYIGLVGYDITDQQVGRTVDNFGWSLDVPRLGRLSRRSAGGVAYPWYANTGNIEVVYTAGRASVPANVRLAALELIRHLYQSSQQASTRVTSYAPGSSDSEGTDGWATTPAGYLVPNRVKELCQPSLRPIVFA